MTACDSFDPSKAIFLARLRGEDHLVRLLNLLVSCEPCLSTMKVLVEATRDQVKSIAEVAQKSPLVLSTGPNAAIVLWDLVSFSTEQSSMLSNQSVILELSNQSVILEIQARGYHLSGDLP